jgi:hypothetical protein
MFFFGGGAVKERESLTGWEARVLDHHSIAFDNLAIRILLCGFSSHAIQFLLFLLLTRPLRSQKFTP